MGLFRDLREVFKTMKRRAPTRIYCPRCGSPQIHVSDRTDILMGPKQYICDRCRYNGPIVMELEKEEN